MQPMREIHQGKFNYVRTKCSICNKEFHPAPNALYKVKKDGKMYHQCSYSHWKQAGGNKGYGTTAR